MWMGNCFAILRIFSLQQCNATIFQTCLPWRSVLAGCKEPSAKCQEDYKDVSCLRLLALLHTLGNTDVHSNNRGSPRPWHLDDQVMCLVSVDACCRSEYPHLPRLKESTKHRSIPMENRCWNKCSLAQSPSKHLQNQKLRRPKFRRNSQQSRL